MRIQEITDIYREMGLGTQAERDEYLKWTFNPPRDVQYATFFIETPNSDFIQTPETERAQLA